MGMGPIHQHVEQQREQERQTANERRAYDYHRARPRAAWDMAAGNPQMQQQWVSWANNPSMHDPSRTQVAMQNFGENEMQGALDALRTEVYGGPMSRPAPQGVQPRSGGGGSIGGGSRNQIIGRILQQWGK